VFSVLIPVYNHAEYVTEALTSALRSTLVDEVLLVDDGSQDHSREVILCLSRSMPDKVCDLTGKVVHNRGAHERLNQLVGAARNEWVAILNSDDVFVPGRFETIAAHIKIGNKCDFIYGDLIIVNTDGVVVGTKRGLAQPEYAHPFSGLSQAELDSQPLSDLLANQNFIATTSNMIFRRSLHERIGGFAPFRYVHDWAFALRAGAAGNPLYLPHFLTKYRVHGSNTINESKERIVTEVKTLFEQFVAEHPECMRRPLFRRALEGNRYLGGTSLSREESPDQWVRYGG
jgi:glycosyltransferase involved in cell wall biosynthesis